MNMAISTMLLLFCAFGLVRAIPPSFDEREQIALFSDVRSLFHPSQDGSFENRIGFSIASLSIDEFVHRLGEEEPSLPGSHDRLRRFAEILKMHPTTRVHIDAHTGTSAPPCIAQGYSEERARIVVEALHNLGVPEERISSAAWGMTIARAAMTSVHPNSASSKSGYGWVDLFIIFASGSSGKEVVLPPRPDYYADLPPAPHRLQDTDQRSSVEEAVDSLRIDAFLSPRIQFQKYDELLEADNVAVEDHVDILSTSLADQNRNMAPMESNNKETSETILSLVLEHVRYFRDWILHKIDFEVIFQWDYHSTSHVSTKSPSVSAHDSRMRLNEASEKPSMLEAIKQAFSAIEGENKVAALRVGLLVVGITVTAMGCLGCITSSQKAKASEQPLLQM